MQAQNFHVSTFVCTVLSCDLYRSISYPYIHQETHINHKWLIFKDPRPEQWRFARSHIKTCECRCDVVHNFGGLGLRTLEGSSERMSGGSPRGDLLPLWPGESLTLPWEPPLHGRGELNKHLQQHLKNVKRHIQSSLHATFGSPDLHCRGWIEASWHV